jgi:hypothetical protein
LNRNLFTAAQLKNQKLISSIEFKRLAEQCSIAECPIAAIYLSKSLSEFRVVREQKLIKDSDAEVLFASCIQRKSICDGRIFIDRPARTNALLKI